jgi:hypothetical protein
MVISSVQRIPSESVVQRIKNFHWLDLTMGIFEAYDKDALVPVLLDREGSLQIGFERRPTRLHDFQLYAERLRKAHRHVDIDAFDLAGGVSEGERPVVLGQADAKNASSNDLVEASGRLGSGKTHEDDQKQASKEARSKSDGTLEKCAGHGNMGPGLQGPMRLQHLADNLHR